MLSDYAKELRNKIAAMYETELENQRKVHEDWNNLDTYFDGWSIIDDADHIKTYEDEIGLLLFAYEENVLNVLHEWMGKSFERSLEPVSNRNSTTLIDTWLYIVATCFS